MSPGPGSTSAASQQCPGAGIAATFTPRDINSGKGYHTHLCSGQCHNCLDSGPTGEYDPPHFAFGKAMRLLVPKSPAIEPGFP